jgi:hypothetical protein
MYSVGTIVKGGSGLDMEHKHATYIDSARKFLLQTQTLYSVFIWHVLVSRFSSKKYPAKECVSRPD